jgi:S-adenosylmethionine:tRNA ribosyltransferase-isomerase
MIAAAGPRPATARRLLDARTQRETSLSKLLHAGDLVVFNDARTLPASLRLLAEDDSSPFEGRLLQPPLSTSAGPALSLTLMLFAGIDHHQATERRTHARVLHDGQRLQLVGRDGERSAYGHVRVSANHLLLHSARVIELHFDNSVLPLVHKFGRPIQYSYIDKELELWDVQTLFARAPCAIEAPSAAYLFNQAQVAELQARGVQFAAITHAAGISSTGDPELDRQLPLPERSEISYATQIAVARAVAERRRVIAVGTSVVRALEGNVDGDGRLRSGTFTTSLRLSGTSQRRIVRGMLTGVHSAGTSHFELLSAFQSATALEAALCRSEQLGLLHHEFGDGWYLEGPLTA